ncbi:MAG: hypothetical protein GXP40_11195 [Chloroflexi bacterium]|nr:hypothetical protein [Chloroflexota bacterium]
MANIQDENIAITYDDGVNTYSTTCPPSDDVHLADRIVISVTTYYEPFLPLVNLPAFPITSETARTIIKDVEIDGN